MIQARLSFWVITPGATRRRRWRRCAHRGWRRRRGQRALLRGGRSDSDASARGAPPARAPHAGGAARPQGLRAAAGRRRVQDPREGGVQLVPAPEGARCWWRWRRARRGTTSTSPSCSTTTAVNVTNLQQFANALPGGGDAPIFTGRCIQRGLNQPGGGRKWVARYMRALAANDTVGARSIAETMPPSGRRPRPALLARPAAPRATAARRVRRARRALRDGPRQVWRRRLDDDALPRFARRALLQRRRPQPGGRALPDGARLRARATVPQEPAGLYRALRRTLANASAIRRRSCGA